MHPVLSFCSPIFQLHTLVGQNFIYLNTSDGNLHVPRHSYYVCEQMTRLLGHTLVVMDKLQAFGLTTGEIALFAAVLLTQGRSPTLPSCQFDNMSDGMKSILLLDEDKLFLEITVSILRMQRKKNNISRLNSQREI